MSFSAEQTVRNWVAQAWNRGDFSHAPTMYAKDYVLADPSAPTGPVHGTEGLVAFIHTFRAAFPDLVMHVEQVISDGASVAWRFRVTGTHRGELFGLPPSGRAIEVTGAVLSRFENGLWVEDFAHWDALGMMKQIGAPALA